jgi:hypothetical protein
MVQMYALFADPAQSPPSDRLDQGMAYQPMRDLHEKKT